MAESEEAAGEIPDIAPPLFLEDIPEPTVLPLGAAPEAAPAEDPYAWASQAESSMEREGRSFDEVAPPFPEEDAWNSGAEAWRDDGSDHGLPDTSHLDDAEDSDAHRWDVEVVAEDDWQPPVPPSPPSAPPVRVRPAPSGAPLGLLLALSIVFAIGSIAVAWMAIRLGSEGAEDLLKPVVLGSRAEPGQRFAVPPEDLAKPPGSAVEEGAWPPPGAVDGPRLEVLTRPPGATVILDGREVGVTPLVVAVRPGTHGVVLRLEGHGTVERAVRVTDARTELVVDLASQAARGVVDVRAPGWDGARVWIDGTPAGTIPMRVELDAGDHVFTLSLGEQRVEVRRTVAPDASRAVVLNLAD